MQTPNLWRILVLLAAMLIVTGCPPPAADDDDNDDADDDDVADDDDDDDVADDDDDDDITSDDDDDDDDNDTGTPPGEGEIWAVIGLAHIEWPDGFGGLIDGGRLDATFYDRDVAPTVHSVMQSPEVSETCALTVYGLDLLLEGEATADALDAGPLTLWRDGDELEFDPMELDGGFAYHYELALGTELVFDDSYIVAIGSQDFPGFDTDMDMPGEIHMTAPAPDTCPELDDDIEVAWTGGDLPTVDIFVVATDPAQDAHGILACRADNDGAFTLPAADLQALGAAVPGGAPVLTLRHRILESVNIDGERRAWLSSGSDLVRICLD